MNKELIEKRNELESKSTILADVFEAAGKDLDLSKVTKFGTEDVAKLTTQAKAEKIRKMNDELTALGKEVDALVAVEKASGNPYLVKGDTDKGIHAAVPANKDHVRETGRKALVAGLLKAAVSPSEWGAFKKGVSVLSFPDIWPSELFRADEIKTLFQTTAGFPPESTRTGILVDKETRPVQLLDRIPSGRTGQELIVYMEETTRTHAAAEAAEAALYPESTFVLTEKSSNVRKIADSIPVTDEQLDDVPQVETYLTDRLQFGVRQRLDQQIYSGNGTAPNLRGLVNVVGIQTQAKGTDPTPDAIYKAMVKVRVTGRANPNLVVIHPNDWQEIRLLRTADGIYIWGSPSDSGPLRIWGASVLEADIATEGTALTFDTAWTRLFERKGVDVQVGFINDDFTKGKKTLRAQGRFAFVLFRPAAASTITGI